LLLAFGQVVRVELRSSDTATANAKCIAANGAAIGLETAPPAPAECRRVGGIGIPFHQLLMDGRIASGQIHLDGGPCQFVVMHEDIAVVRDLLIGTILAVLSNSVEQELPAEL